MLFKDSLFMILTILFSLIGSMLLIGSFDPDIIDKSFIRALSLVFFLPLFLGCLDVFQDWKIEREYRREYK